MESDKHRRQMNLLIEVIDILWQHRDDFFVGGNMFIYYSALQSKKNDFRGTDFFVVLNTVKKDREIWVTWEEDGRYPSVVVELTSDSTRDIDRGEKKRIYEKVLRVREYFIYDPKTDEFEGYRLNESGSYQPIMKNPDQRLRCEQLGLWLGLWKGSFQTHNWTWLRFFHDDGSLVPTEAEAREQERQKAEQERQKAEAHATDLLAQLRAYEQKFGPLPGK